MHRENAAGHVREIHLYCPTCLRGFQDGRAAQAHKARTDHVMQEVTIRIREVTPYQKHKKVKEIV